jgi:hypothetical protein
MIVQLTDRLIEETILLAVATDPRLRGLHAEREPLYSIEGPEERDRAFAELYRRRFLELGLERPVSKSLDEQPVLERAIARCIVGKAGRAADEGVELYVAPEPHGPRVDEDRRLHIRLRPQTLLRPSELRMLLRGELLHVADMLDPDFGYSPSLPPAPAGPTQDRLVIDRYAALWSTTVWGRLARDGTAAPDARERCLRRLAAVFPGVGQGTEALLDSLFDGRRPTHAELSQLALDPRAEGLHTPGGRCALCSLPTWTFEPAEALEAETCRRVREDFPHWKPRDGLCPQCAELYRSRRLAPLA